MSARRRTCWSAPGSTAPSATTCWSRSRTAGSLRSTVSGRSRACRAMQLPDKRRVSPASRGNRTASPASPSPASRTATATRSTGRCGGGPSGSGGRSGPGASRCTPSRRRSTPTPTSRWPGRPTARWRPPGSRAVGEFHYLHHQPDGTPYDDPNAMGHALRRGGRARPGSGSRCSTPATSAAGFGEPAEGVQVRYTDGDADAWAERVATWTLDDGDVVVGAAVHSVRAVPARPADDGRARPPTGRPLHVHLSEQVAENDACLAAYGATPTAAARRRRRARPADHRRARHPPDRRRHPAPRREPHLRLLLPHHRARPRRRHRPEPRAARRRRPAHARLRQPRGDRPVRGDARGRARRAAGHPAARALDRRRAARRGHAPTATPASASTTPARSPSGSAPTWSRSTPTRPRTAGTGADEHTAVFAAAAEDVTQVVVDGRVVVRQGDRAARSAASWTRRDRQRSGRGRR